MTCLLLAAALEIINCLKQLRAILFYVCSPYLALVSAQQCFLKKYFSRLWPYACKQ